MKTYMALDGLRWSRDSGSEYYDMSQSVVLGRPGGGVRVRIIHGLNISHKELTYLLQKSTSHQKPSTTRMLLGG